MNKLVGFDEVGRGPLAGPVVVACVLQDSEIEIPDDIVIRDSKKMTEKQKVKANEFIRANFQFGIGQVSARQIDDKGISNGVRKAAMLALENLKNKIRLDLDKIHIIVDGRDEWFIGCETIVKGDSKVKEISMASIIAKVYRDSLMRKLGEKYPEYGFEKHVGYGTRQHREAIIRYRLIEGVHRRSFCGKLVSSF